ncbi:hypothetical protein B0H14DRAFT_3780204 [Mycena olivaceomarginata]|nr:hypothetical protein B0H14DRAFT_3780204 [Mycena olivaceomarginata]
MLQSLEPTALASPGTTSRHTGLLGFFSAHLPYPPGAVDTAHLPGSFGLPAWEKSLMTSILSAGTFFGALVTGDVADVLGWPLDYHHWLYVGVGFISAIIILHMSEIAPKKACGALVSGYQFAITIGILLANCVVQATQNGSTLQWRGRGAGRHWGRCCICRVAGSAQRVCCLRARMPRWMWMERRSAIRDPGPAGGCRDGGSGLARQVSRAVGLGLGAVPGKPLNTGSFDMVIQDLACFMISNMGEYVDQAEIRGNT